MTYIYYIWIKLIRFRQLMQRLVSHVREVVKRQGGQFKPIFVTDIDGVLVRGSTPVKGTRDAVVKLKQANIPLALLTNGGGNLQKIKASKMNELFKEEIYDPLLMFMSHSPIRPYLKKYSSQGGILLITGSLKIQEIVEEMGIHNYVTADEIYTLFRGSNQQNAHNKYGFYLDQEGADKVRERVMKRLGRDKLPSTYHDWGQQIQAIFALNDVNPYQKALQVIHNIFHQKKSRDLPLPPYFAGHNDIAFAGGYHRPRMAFGPFNYMLENHCERHGFNLNKNYFGKPVKAVFEYVQGIMVQKYGQGCFFMVGDNPRADIQGANSVGWASFLTQTGVHQGPQNDEENPATMVVQTFEEAVQAVLKIQKDKLYQE